jgi:hypothetical protein
MWSAFSGIPGCVLFAGFIGVLGKSCGLTPYCFDLPWPQLSYVFATHDFDGMSLPVGLLVCFRRGQGQSHYILQFSAGTPLVFVDRAWDFGDVYFPQNLTVKQEVLSLIQELPNDSPVLEKILQALRAHSAAQKHLDASRNESLILSERSLAEGWDRPEEDEVWTYLQWER